MDATKIRDKLVGNEQERAVSPVIGVILMVAITVILAAVIAAFVLDLGGSVGQEAQAGVSIEEDTVANEVTIEVTSLGNSDGVDIQGTHDFEGSGDFSVDGDVEGLQVGDVTVIENDGHDGEGTVTAVAYIDEDDTRTQVASEDFDFST
ncbi:type IV pilin N-terminal domain-containing protein [Natrialba sp. INN-245]|uniref:type IV pilin n=1 Tax=Natrialba sp. INN-245 TaxID=2690967 RepID=UPI00131079F2|nr:type IV pilin N-terminal domain-containing protein [Natrialba sp. INN-245]MWV40638.1 type IV pilin [Natrialba sp. INN-245]